MDKCCDEITVFDYFHFETLDGVLLDTHPLIIRSCNNFNGTKLANYAYFMCRKKNIIFGCNMEKMRPGRLTFSKLATFFIQFEKS